MFRQRGPTLVTSGDGEKHRDRAAPSPYHLAHSVPPCLVVRSVVWDLRGFLRVLRELLEVKNIFWLE
ncbi:MAG TPA: hypothetical protein VFF50_13820 [Candidatus Deferrimicrobiaceae bacterium]|jgi:hypothetical protein|nr:hypothetical protein [Candidatus Deferrimicrobiaceae bacterium]